MQDEHDRPAAHWMTDEQIAGLAPDAQPTFEGERLRTDPGVEPGVPVGADDDHVGGGDPEPETITPGPAPTGEEPDTRPPLVLDLNMNKVKLRELRACERILAIVFGRVVPVLPMLEEMPADLAIALLAHKKLVSEGVDCSRLTDSGVLEVANDVREAFAWAEEIDFADLGAPAQGEGEGQPPADPTVAASGNGHGPSAIDTSTSRQPS